MKVFDCGMSYCVSFKSLKIQKFGERNIFLLAAGCSARGKDLNSTLVEQKLNFDSYSFRFGECYQAHFLMRKQSRTKNIFILTNTDEFKYMCKR